MEEQPFIEIAHPKTGERIKYPADKVTHLEAGVAKGALERSIIELRKNVVRADTLSREIDGSAPSGRTKFHDGGQVLPYRPQD